MNTFEKNRSSGFTIAELAVVIVIIGILAGVAIIGYNGWKQTLAANTVKSDLSNVFSSMENANNFSKTGYPTAIPSTIVASSDVTLTGGGRPGGVTFCVQGVSSVNPTKTFYVSNKQKDPKEGLCTITSAVLAGSASSGAYVNGVGASANFFRIEGFGISNQGTVYVGDEVHVRKVTPDGTVTTYNGTGSDGFGAIGANQFAGVRGVAVDASGNIYVLPINNNTIYKISPTGVRTVHTPNIHGTDLILGKDNNFYALEGDNWSGKLFKVTMAGVATVIAGNATNASIDGQGVAASLHDPRSIARKSDGNIFICDGGSGLIRRVSPTYYVSTYAGSGSSYAGGATSPIAGWCGAVGVDNNDVLYVAGGNKIQSIDKNGVVADLVNISGSPSSMAVDENNNIYYSTGRVLYKVTIP